MMGSGAQRNERWWTSVNGNNGEDAVMNRRRKTKYDMQSCERRQEVIEKEGRNQKGAKTNTGGKTEGRLTGVKWSMED